MTKLLTVLLAWGLWGWAGIAAIGLAGVLGAVVFLRLMADSDDIRPAFVLTVIFMVVLSLITVAVLEALS